MIRSVARDGAPIDVALTLRVAEVLPALVVRDLGAGHYALSQRVDEAGIAHELLVTRFFVGAPRWFPGVVQIVADRSELEREVEATARRIRWACERGYAPTQRELDEIEDEETARREAAAAAEGRAMYDYYDDAAAGTRHYGVDGLAVPAAPKAAE